jgi:hypothetical protein
MSVTSRWSPGWPEDSLAAAVDRAVNEGGGRLAVEVVGRDGRAAVIAFRLRLDSVEVWTGEHCNAVLDRDVLRAWLHEPVEPLVVDELTLTLDRMVDVWGRVALTLPVVDAWALSPTDQATLMARV